MRKAQGLCVSLLAVVVDKLSPNRVFLSGNRGDLWRSPQHCLSNNFSPSSSASPDRSLCTDTLSSWNTSLVVWSVAWTSGNAHTQTHIVQLTPPHTHRHMHVVVVPESQTSIFTIACKLPLFTSRLSYTCSLVPDMYTACATVAACF